MIALPIQTVQETFDGNDPNHFKIPLPADGNWFAFDGKGWDKVLVWIDGIDIEGMNDVGAPGTVSAVRFSAPYWHVIWVTARNVNEAQRYWGHPVPDQANWLSAGYVAGCRNSDG